MTVEIEVKALIRGQYGSDPIKGFEIRAKRLGFLKFISSSLQLNHYFSTRGLDTDSPFFALLKSEFGLEANPNSSIRTRFEQINGEGKVTLIVKSALHGEARQEHEVEVNQPIETLDANLEANGLSIESKWSRMRTSYTLSIPYKQALGTVNVALDLNSGYGHVLELEKLLDDRDGEAHRAYVKKELIEILGLFNLSLFTSPLIDQMYEAYKADWGKYYGTADVIPTIGPKEQIDNAYLSVIRQIQKEGLKKPVFGQPDLYRYSVQGVSFHHDMGKSFPALTSKTVAVKKAILEMLWFIQGTGDVRFIIKHKLNIWDGWAARYYGTVDWKEKVLSGEFQPYIPIHYANGSNWNGTGLSQFDWIVEQLPRNPSRNSYVVSYWNPEQVYHMADKIGREQTVLPACHFTHQLLTREAEPWGDVQRYYLDIHVIMRSWDFPAGAPFNIAQYAALAQMYQMAMNTGKGKELGVEFLLGNLYFYGTDVHFYSNQQETIDEQLEALTSPIPPRLTIRDRGQKSLMDFEIKDFKIENYFPSEKIFVPVAVVGGMN